MSTKTFRVINNRIHFLCPSCSAKRFLAVQPDVRKRSVRCHNCSMRTQCNLNRRATPRETQTGRCLMFVEQGREIEIYLHDISMGGLGFDLPNNASSALSIRQELRFKCGWNSGLLQHKYVVRSINGRRIGAEKI